MANHPPPDDSLSYEERFVLRMRIHSLTAQGIRTRQIALFRMSDTIVPYEALGRGVQYNTDFNALHLLMALFGKAMGIRGLSISAGDPALFFIATGILAISVYSIGAMLFTLKYVGSFYFSDSTEKEKGAFEIKSKYPPSEQLQRFITAIRQKQKEIAQRELLSSVNPELHLYYHKTSAEQLKDQFAMTEEEYEAFWQAIKEKYRAKRIRTA
jgi:hypothetical protein